jgi:16S rRNA (cytidine1402-2'-O)-methyltransferase
MPATLALVATPIGNLEDITLRALRVLREASVIAAEDTRRTARLLAHYGITTPMVSLHDHNERDRVPGLIARLRAGDTVAVVSDAGMPTISDPGYLIVRAAIGEGFRVDVIPGASALTSAVAGSGLPVETVSFVGFAPARSAERRRWLTELLRLPGSIVLFEAPTRIRALLEAAVEILGDRESAVAHELTKVHESWNRGTISQILSEQSLPGKGEFTVVLGPARVDRPVNGAINSLNAEAAWVEFGQLIENDGLSRRDAIAELADRHALSKKTVYALVEEGKNSVK